MAASRTRLLPIDAFAPVFEPLTGRRIGYVRPYGNVGDALIDWATRQLFAEFHIDWEICDPNADRAEDFDELVFGGGGNMGTRYRNNWELRSRVLALGLPVTVLPQSFTSPEERPYRRVYVRERASMAFCPQALLSPDLALGLEHDVGRPPTRGLGVFLRRDPERATGLRWLSRDPARVCRTPQEYLDLAASYERIVTDRLHFAICGLLAGRETTLLPNDYHKNASMYETWLKTLGCRFARNARAAVGWRTAA
ncbi:MAG: hypothetical protein A2W31_05720 [Planctomycetes bacterium RBG_16_64_10]|nr:MAG: hypothetical protein A2W31_05720 [Planctomycetes bacterium RBG_16_64_10]